MAICNSISVKLWLTCCVLLVRTGVVRCYDITNSVTSRNHITCLAASVAVTLASSPGVLVSASKTPLGIHPEDKAAASSLKDALEGLGLKVPDSRESRKDPKMAFDAPEYSLMHLDYSLLMDDVDEELRNGDNISQTGINPRGWDAHVDTFSCPQPAQCTLDRIDARDIVAFNKHYRGLKPVILRGGTMHWPAVSGNASRRWTMQRLREISNELPKGMELGSSQEIVTHTNLRSIKLADYLDYMIEIRNWRRQKKSGPTTLTNRENEMSDTDSSRDTNAMPLIEEQCQPDAQHNAFIREPWYIFHRGVWSSSDPYKKWIEKDCPVSRPELQGIADGDPGDGSGAFMEFIIGIGAPGTGIVMHKHGETWVHMIEGSKRVLMYPPWKAPSTLPAPRGIRSTHAEWIKRIYSQHPGGSWSPYAERVEAEECTIHRGDILYIPDGWLHGTTNCVESVSVAMQPRSPSPIGDSYYALLHEGRKLEDHETIPRVGYVKSYEGNSVVAVRARNFKAKFLKQAIKLQPFASEPYIYLTRLYLKGNTLKSNKVALKYVDSALQLAPESISAHLYNVEAIAQRVQLLMNPNVSSSEGGLMSSEIVPEEDRDSNGRVLPEKMKRHIDSRKHDIIVAMKQWVDSMERCMEIDSMAHPGWIREGGNEGKRKRREALSPSFDNVQNETFALHESWAQLDTHTIARIIHLTEKMMPTIMTFGVDFFLDLGADVPATWAKRAYIRSAIGKLVLLMHAEACDWKEEWRINPYSKESGEGESFALSWSGFMELGASTLSDDNNGNGDDESKLFSSSVAFDLWKDADTPVMKLAKEVTLLLSSIDESETLLLSRPVTCGGETEVRTLEWLSKTPRFWRD